LGVKFGGQHPASPQRVSGSIKAPLHSPRSRWRAATTKGQSRSFRWRTSSAADRYIKFAAADAVRFFQERAD
jgi:hypothetical protein